MPVVFVKKNAPTLQSCWHKYFTKKHHLNVKCRFTLYAQARMVVTKVSVVEGLGVN